MSYQSFFSLLAAVSLLSSILSAHAQSLPEALDYGGADWATGGSTQWFGQSQVTADGIDAVQAGIVSHNQNSHLETTLSGPGTGRFHWRVSSEGSYDYLRFFIGGVQQKAISGSSGWLVETFSLDEGAHALRWVYEKDGSVNSGSETGWLDRFEYQFDAVQLATPSGTRTVEDGTEVTFSINLRFVPSADVSIPVSSTGLTEAAVAPEVLIFKEENWDQPQLVGVRGITDGEDDGDVAYEVLGPATSADPVYDGLDPGAVSLVNEQPKVATNSTELRTLLLNLSGDTLIELAPGTYSPVDDGLGAYSFHIAYGTTLTIRGIDEDRSRTVLDGKGRSRLLNVNGQGTLVLENLTFQDGIADTGGAVYSRSFQDLHVKNCAFLRNRAYNSQLTRQGAGGAIEWFLDSEMTVSDSLFQGNSASDNGANDADGGALYLYGSSPDVITIARTSFINNRAGTSSSGRGGAIFTHAPVYVYESWFEGNQAYHGGGIYGSAMVRRSIFIGNKATGANINEKPHGGALSSASYVANSYFEGNTALRGGAIDTASLLLGNTFYNNSNTVREVSCIVDNVIAKSGGYGVDTTRDLAAYNFLDSSSLAVAPPVSVGNLIGDYLSSIDTSTRIPLPDSALVDAGVPDEASLDDLLRTGCRYYGPEYALTDLGHDISHSARVGRADIGAYEYIPPIITYELILDSTPPEGGQVSGAGSYENGTEAPISATPSPGYRFVRWVGGGVADASRTSTRVTMSEARSLTARFEPIPLDLSWLLLLLLE